VTPLGFGLAVYAAGRWFKNSQGSGIPQAIVEISPWITTEQSTTKLTSATMRSESANCA
jgi:hypothetical protein